MKTISKKLISTALVLTMLFSMAGLTLAAGEYDASGATAFKFTDTGITVSEGNYSGYKIEGTALTINSAGTYIVSGSCSDGSITVKKGTTGVTLVLNGLTLTSSDTAPITCNKSSGVTIVAAAGTTNNLTDSAKNNDEAYPDNENAENAVIKCKDGSQVTICGTGTINITANGKNGIKSGETTDTEGEASLTIKDVTLNITASENDGINAGSTLDVLSGKITVSAGDDGIKSDYTLNIGSEGANGPTILVKSSTEGLEGATINIYSGDIEIHASEDGVNAANSDLSGWSYELNVYGGKLYVDAATGDGLDSNGTINLAGGTIEVYSASSGDNAPIDGERGTTIGEATVLAVGAPGMGVSVSGQAAVAFGSSGMMGGGRLGGMGGMNGGFPTDGDSGATPQFPGMGGDTTGLAAETDSDTLTAATLGRGGNMGGMPGDMGGEMMGGFPGGDNSGGMMGGDMSGTGSVSVSAGRTIAIQDESGNTIYTATALRSASYVLFSSPELTEGSTYTLKVNGTDAGTATASASAGGAGGFGGMNGGMNGGMMGGFPGGDNSSEMPTQPGGDMGGQRPDRSGEAQPAEPAQPEESTEPETPDEEETESSDTASVTLGDLNGDGEIDMKDVSILASYLAGFGPLSESEQKAADYDGSGAVGNMDLLRMIAYIVFKK